MEQREGSESGDDGRKYDEDTAIFDKINNMKTAEDGRIRQSEKRKVRKFRTQGEIIVNKKASQKNVSAVGSGKNPSKQSDHVQQVDEDGAQSQKK